MIKALITAAVLLLTAPLVPALAHDYYGDRGWRHHYGWRDHDGWRDNYRWRHYYGWRDHYRWRRYGDWRY